MNHKPVNFDELVKQVCGTQVGKDKLSIWGNKCSEAQALTLVQHWPTLAQMPYRIWEYSSSIVFGRDTLPDNVQWLERGRLFGEGGTLSLCRDGDHFHWWFVGPAGACPPDGFGGKDFWQAEPEAQFHEYEVTALLWGKGNQVQVDDQERRQWFEDRVARAKLRYPVNGQPERVQVEYRTYSRDGRIEFVWLTKLSKWEGKNNV